MPAFRHRHGPRQGISVDVLEWGELELGHYRCRPDSPAWAEDNQISEGTLLVVPHRAVEIAQASADTVIASPAHAVFYRRRQIYRRRLIDPRGDDCVYVCLPDATWRRLLADVWPAVGEADEVQLPVCGGPIRPATYLAFARLVDELRAGRVPSRLAFEERLLELVDVMLRDAIAVRTGRRIETAAHERLARAAEAVVAERFCDNWGLDELAAGLDTSPAHLGRVFRRYVGTSIHQQRIRLRLAAAVELGADPRRSLTDIAMQLGFASPSHFSDQFRRHMGQPPSALRGSSTRQRRRLRDKAGI